MTTPIHATQPPIPAPRPETGTGTSYTVKPGDSLSQIARQMLGNGNAWGSLYELNKELIGANPDQLKPGMVLQLRMPETTPAPSEPAAIAPAEGQYETYTVQSGDSLYKIAQQELGNGNAWGELYSLNSDLIGPNPDQLQPGMELKIRPQPAAQAPIDEVAQPPSEGAATPEVSFVEDNETPETETVTHPPEVAEASSAAAQEAAQAQAQALLDMFTEQPADPELGAALATFLASDDAQLLDDAVKTELAAAQTQIESNVLQAAEEATKAAAQTALTDFEQTLGLSTGIFGQISQADKETRLTQEAAAIWTEHPSARSTMLEHLIKHEQADLAASLLESDPGSAAAIMQQPDFPAVKLLAQLKDDNIAGDLLIALAQTGTEEAAGILQATLKSFDNFNPLGFAWLDRKEPFSQLTQNPAFSQLPAALQQDIEKFLSNGW